MKMRFVIKFLALMVACCCFSVFAAGQAMAKPKYRQQQTQARYWQHSERHSSRWDRGGRREYYVRPPVHRNRSYYQSRSYSIPKSYHRSERHWRRR
jgi:hypothetical protein